jgi:hypothetical protein
MRDEKSQLIDSILKKKAQMDTIKLKGLINPLNPNPIHKFYR